MRDAVSVVGASLVSTADILAPGALLALELDLATPGRAAAEPPGV
jgi:hypothetical protein